MNVPKGAYKLNMHGAPSIVCYEPGWQPSEPSLAAQQLAGSTAVQAASTEAPSQPETHFNEDAPFAEHFGFMD